MLVNLFFHGDPYYDNPESNKSWDTFVAEMNSSGISQLDYITQVYNPVIQVQNYQIYSIYSKIIGI